MQQFYINSSEAEFDFIVLTETWLFEDIRTSEFLHENYSAFRCDRNFERLGVSRGGGVLIAFKNSYSCEKLDLSDLLASLFSFDILGIKINLEHNYLLIFVIYVPSTPSVDEFEILTDFFVKHFSNESNVFIVGDFNTRKFCENNINDRTSLSLNNFSNILNFQQHNTVYNAENRLLDFLISTVPFNVMRRHLLLRMLRTTHPYLSA